MLKTELFIERPDNRIWPIPGVYACKGIFEENGIYINIHDSFLKIPSELLINYLKKFYGDKVFWISIYIGGFYYEELKIDFKSWLEGINSKIGLIRNSLPNFNSCIISLAGDDSNFKEIFFNSQAVLVNGYDSILDYANLVNLKNNNLIYSDRKFVNYPPANGFQWRSLNLMIDMPPLICPIGYCRNCDLEKNNCDIYLSSKVNVLHENFDSLEREILVGELPLNLMLTGNPLTLNNTKLKNTYELINKISPNNSIELHLEINFFDFFCLSESWALIKKLRIGSLKLIIPLYKEYCENFEKLVFDTIVKIRNIIGYVPYILINFIAGFPGNNLSLIKLYISSLECYVDLICLEENSLNINSKLAKSGEYKLNSTIDIWGNCDWELPSLSRKELVDFILLHKLNLYNSKNIAYLAYSDIYNILHASNDRYSSIQIREDINLSKINKDIAISEFNKRHQLELNKYINSYNNVSGM
ncbi:hypothetical protein [Acinetobacter sp. NEB 394]|uniref:hypothetical protein n=1 Tax=Acinetobacter sp. NEB 394 TaxID=2743575 RepID=UPI00159707B1|nr:hypothetical protein [Acinetobacter sp. NEB 394]QKY89413.1 hypothetical protein HUK62_01885 [Acinetobacter sp. NEB 394]